MEQDILSIGSMVYLFGSMVYVISLRKPLIRANNLRRTSCVRKLCVH